MARQDHDLQGLISGLARPAKPDKRGSRFEMHDNDDDIGRPASGGSRLSRRSLLATAAGGAVSAAAGKAMAQSPFSWIENLSGQGFGDGRKAPSSEPSKAQEQLNDLRPDNVPWRSDEMLGRMDQAIERYERIVANGGWPAIPAGRLLRLDDDDDRLIAIKKRLGMSGDLRAPQGYFNSPRFDERLEEAIRSFQEQFGLRVTGRIDKPTAGQLAAPARARLEQLVLNQKRLRDLTMGRIEDR